MKMTLTELDCLTLFENEPERAFGDNWFDSSNIYQISYANNLRLSCAIYPIHKDVRIMISLDEVTLVDIEFIDVEKIKYNENPIESLTISDINGSDWRLTVKPFPVLKKLENTST